MSNKVWEVHFTRARTVLKLADELVLADEYEGDRIEMLSEEISKLNSILEQIASDETTEFVNAKCKVLSPRGGIYDSNVQRLLALSGCLRYDHKVRSVYYVGVGFNT